MKSQLETQACDVNIGRGRANTNWEKNKLINSSLVVMRGTMVWALPEWPGEATIKGKVLHFIHKATRQFSARSHMVSVGGGVGVYFSGGSHFQPCVWFLLIFLSATTRDALQNFAHPGCFPYSVLAYYFSLLSSGWVLIVVCGLYFSPWN